jgi:plastocyanin domain-containing protein
MISLKIIKYNKIRYRVLNKFAKKCMGSILIALINLIFLIYV